MESKLERSLRHMQANPTTGLPHNQQVVTAQVETIFAVDTLTREIAKLRDTLDKSGKQNASLEASNYRLQVVMAVLTAISTSVALTPFFRWIVTNIPNLAGLAGANALDVAIRLEPYVSILTTVIGVISALGAYYVEKIAIKNVTVKINETLSIRDSFNAVAKDNEGRIKDIRNSD